MEVIEGKALKLRLRNPHKVLNVIPKSALIEDGPISTVLVKWGLEEAQVLKNLKIKNVPSPIIGRYKWPGIYEPFSHQKQTAAFLTLHRRAFCFNDPGTGKTLSVTWACDYLMNLKHLKRVLIICPLSIMQSAWQADIFKGAMHRKVGVAHGSKAKRQQIIASDAEFVIINFDGVAVVEDEISNGGFDMIVVDECFVAGTLVSTPLGRRPIEQLEAGDKVLTSDGVMCIKRLVRNTATQLVEVKLGNGKTIRCTPDHPFFTDAGWVCAKNLAGRRLISGVELSCLRAGIPPGNAPNAMALGAGPRSWHDLFQILRTEEMALPQPKQEHLQQLVARAAGETVRTEDGGTPGKAVRSGESEWAQTPSAWGQRHGDDTRRVVDFRGFTCGLGMELPSSVGQEAARLSYELQARLCVAAPQGRAGSGRQQPHNTGTPSTGPEEGSEAGGAWVESVSHIECPDGEAVYNLEVEGTPNYFVGDHWLVHNCNAYKTATTTRWKTLNRILKPNMWLWMLTGTPASQSPLDAYGLAKLVNPSETPRAFTSFRDQVMYKATQFKWMPKLDANATVNRMLQPAIRFTKEQCLDLPDMLYTTRDVPLTSQQSKYYEQLRKQMVMQAAGEEVTAVNAAAKLNKLLQVSCGAVYSDTGEVVTFDASNRTAVLKEVIDETPHKVLVFVPFRHAIEILYDELRKSGITAMVIHGGVSAGRRTEIFKQFQEQPDPKVLVVQPQAASHGVTLHAANTVVWWAPITSYETYAQANARVHRAGQRNKCLVVKLQGSPVESKLYKALDSKEEAQMDLMELYKDTMKESEVGT